ncbi:MAG: LUD domain-containing protein [Bacteroidota bacterium]
MTSREQILARVKSNQPDLKPLPEAVNAVFTAATKASPSCNVEQFRTVLTTIGGTLIEVSGYEEIAAYIQSNYTAGQRVISTIPELSAVTEQGWEDQDPHSYENIDLAILTAHFGVAENAGLWITEALMQQRVVPFICQQLAVVVSKNGILTTMHEAYTHIGNAEYGFGAFIAGPSKTADIEQSLVLGAHGPKGMTVFLI